MSDPQLVAVIRRLQREHVIYRLKNDGKDPPTGPLLRAAMDQAAIRRIEILHPELS